MTSGSSFPWTNRSVKALAGKADPVTVIEERAQSIVLSAMDHGWSGPPFDPIKLADLIKVAVEANADIRDARTVSDQAGGFIIKFNPNRPRARVRFSIAHEIAHTLFPDCAEDVRNRAHREATKGDDWQLELLCNIAASELIMPIGSFGDLSDISLEIDHIMELRKKYDVSTEAILLRTTKLAREPVAMFVASRVKNSGGKTDFRIDYSYASRSWRLPSLTTSKLDGLAVLEECTAVGYTAKTTQRWPGLKGLYQIECVGMPSYPGGRYPRVGGIVKPVRAQDKKERSISYVRGNALDPRGDDSRLIVHIVNDRTPNWGGGGFASASRKVFPSVQKDFRAWSNAKTDNLTLGNVHFSDIDQNLTVASMIAQKGFGPSNTPRIRYEALSTCLVQVAEFALARDATIHMPRIGVGHAGGSWSTIEELIKIHFIDRCISVTVYDLPEKTGRSAPDGFLDEFASTAGTTPWRVG